MLIIDNEKEYRFFQQDGATCQRLNDSVNRFHAALTNEQVVSKRQRPPRSPDLSTCDSFLWAYLQEKVNASSPHNRDELKVIFQQKINAIKKNVLHVNTIS